MSDTPGFWSMVLTYLWIKYYAVKHAILGKET